MFGLSKDDAKTEELKEIDEKKKQVEEKLKKAEASSKEKELEKIREKQDKLRKKMKSPEKKEEKIVDTSRWEKEMQERTAEERKEVIEALKKLESDNGIKHLRKVEKRMSPAEIERNEIRGAVKEFEEKKKQESDLKLMKKFEQLSVEELKELYNEREKIDEEWKKIREEWRKIKQKKTLRADER